MSNRERWIIYPLLFYALAMGFKSNYVSPLEFRCQSIACRNLTVTDGIQTNTIQVRAVNGMAALVDFSAAIKAAMAAASTAPPTAPDEESPDGKTTDDTPADHAAPETKPHDDAALEGQSPTTDPNAPDPASTNLEPADTAPTDAAPETSAPGNGQ